MSGVKTWCGGGGRSATTTGAGAPQVDPAPPGAVARPAGSLLPSGRGRLHLQRQPAAAALPPGRGRLTSPAGEGLAGQPHPLTKGGKGSADGTGSSARSAAGRAAAAPAAGGAKSNSWSAAGAAAGGRTARWPCLARAASLGSGCGQAERGRRRGPAWRGRCRHCRRRGRRRRCGCSRCTYAPCPLALWQTVTTAPTVGSRHRAGRPPPPGRCSRCFRSAGGPPPLSPHGYHSRGPSGRHWGGGGAPAPGGRCRRRRHVVVIGVLRARCRCRRRCAPRQRW